MKQFYKKYYMAILLITFSTVFVIVIKCYFDAKFWGDFLANLLATVVGLIVGIPIAIALSNYQEHEVEQERKEKIISLLSQELFVSYNQLVAYKNNTDKEAVLIILSGFLSDESWRAFSDGGELEWVKDPQLLSDLSWAYGSIQTLKYVLEKHYSYTLHVRIKIPATEKYLRDMTEKGIDNAIRDITEALKAMMGVDKAIEAMAEAEEALKGISS
ncbi:MAG: hypothetical protein ISR58_13170 [Anaerolineales bacterium]|nr:hypothetical protein [Candidatus Brocadiales bacterium]MBL6982127.1 hypothetical protein [Anaerolineales bacterium]